MTTLELLAREGTDAVLVRLEIEAVRPLRRVLARLANVRHQGYGWVGTCPACHNRSESLKLTERDDGSVLIHCHAGCAAQAIVAALGLNFADLFAAPPAPAKARLIAAAPKAVM